MSLGTIFLAPSTVTDPIGKATPPSSPIWVADKSKCHRPIHNVFIDKRGFPDQSDKFDVLLHNIEGGPILWKLKAPASPSWRSGPSFLVPIQ